MEALKNRAYVITGAAGGVGEAVARRLRGNGASLVLCDSGCDERGEGRDPARLEAAAERVGASPGDGRVLVEHADVRDAGTVRALVERSAAELGGFDGFVHAVGIVRESSLLRLADDDLGGQLDTMVSPSFRVIRDAGDALVAGGRGGSIVLMVNPSAFFGVARQAVGAACSGAVLALVRTAALELRKHGIRVNAVAPTARTRLTDESPFFKSIRPDSMTADQVAPLVSFLLSDAARDVSGEWLGAAGGKIYALTAVETTGAFLGPAHTEDEIAQVFGDVLRLPSR